MGTTGGTTKTAVADVRAIPLGRLSSAPSSATRRIVPPAQTPKPPVAAFDSAL